MPKRKTIRSIKTIDIRGLTFYPCKGISGYGLRTEYAAATVAAGMDALVMRIFAPTGKEYCIAAIDHRDWRKFEPWNGIMPKVRSQWYPVQVTP